MLNRRGHRPGHAIAMLDYEMTENSNDNCASGEIGGIGREDQDIYKTVPDTHGDRLLFHARRARG